MTLFFCALSINAQNSTTYKNHIEWEGVQTWKTDFDVIKVLSFKNAHYVNQANNLPYFVKRITANLNLSYSVEITNKTFNPLSDTEVKLLDINFINEKISANSRIKKNGNDVFLIVEILPFIKKEKKYYRLSSFDIKVKTTPKPQRVSGSENSLHTFVKKSVLNSGKFVKVAVKESGIYKITYDELKDMGVVPEKVRVFGYGGALLSQDFTKQKIDDLPENTIWVEKGADGVFNSGDYILFYGQGVVKWHYNIPKYMFTHTLNNYANEGYYFITSDVGQGKRITEKTENVPADATIIDVTDFTDYKLHEEEKLNLGETGKVFYGEEFNTKTTYNFDFNFPNVITNSSSVRTRLDVATISGKNSSFDLSLNGSQTQTINVAKNSTSWHEIGQLANSKQNFSPKKSNLKFTLSYNKGDGASKGYLNYLEINAKRKLKMVGNVMFFRNKEYLQTDIYSKYKLTNANANIQIWDITNPNEIKRVKTSLTGTTLEFIGSNMQMREYVAINPKSAKSFTLKPKVIGDIKNQNLHAMPNAEFLIITHPNFLQDAERLAQAHRDIDKMSVNVVTTEQVYNEFSSGTPDASAYRWFVKMFNDRALENPTSLQKPKYLLLLGRGSYDNRGIIRNSGNNLVLTYQAEISLHHINSFVTDDYFGFLDNDEGVNIISDMVDIGIGRFSVSTQEEAKNVVDKTISYMRNDISGIWKNQLVFLADDGDGGLHMKQIDSIASRTAKNYPAFQVQKIYLDAFQQETSASGESYPIARAKFHNMINSGSLLVDYMGHAGPLNWTNERILSKHDILNMYNKKLPFLMTATCDFSRFDVKEVSGGEQMLLNPNGGGIGLYSAARTVYASRNEQLNIRFTEKLFEKTNGQYPRIGDVIKYSKNKVGSGRNKLSYMLFGDPAVRLNYPKEYNVVTEKIDDKPISSKEETFNALSVKKISGTIKDENNNVISDFNGKLEITIYDKEQKITTLNNDKDGSTYNYLDRPNILYSGKADVKNGKFSFVFMVPRDIRYNIGGGRINYYATDTITHKEAQGYFHQFKVGGSNSNANYEKEGPKVSLYLNTSDFKSEDKVNESPLLVATISDVNGINTSGNGIGHDLRLVIDANQNTSYTLNSYFQADANSYTSGVVKFKIPALEEGKHTLTLHAWDLLNNSTTVTTDFEVVNGLQPVIFNVANYPNPVKNATNFVVNHNRPETVLEAVLDIYDLSGRHIVAKKYAGTENIRWDLKNNSGKKVRAGAYIYKISIKTKNSKFTSKANKIIVLEQ